MTLVHRTLFRRVAAAAVAGATTLTLFSTVVAFSEPQRSERVAAAAARQAVQARAQAEPLQVSAAPRQASARKSL